MLFSNALVCITIVYSDFHHLSIALSSDLLCVRLSRKPCAIELTLVTFPSHFCIIFTLKLSFMLMVSGTVIKQDVTEALLLCVGPFC